MAVPVSSRERHKAGAVASLTKRSLCGMKHLTLIMMLPATLALGCKAKKPATETGAGEAKPGESGGGSVTLNASGATFQQAFQEVAIEAFSNKSLHIRVNYGAGGSGKGRQDFADQVVDFACTDAPYKEADLGKVKGGEFFYIPTLLGAIAVTYNVEGAPALKLSPTTLARIFMRQIKTWNDPAIAAENSGVTLPATPIVVVRRSDGSGTTENFTKFLSLAAADAWPLKSGSTVEWPTDTQAAAGNGGIAQMVQSTKGAIGYVDLSDAKASGLTLAAVRNAAGEFVMPDASSITVAGDGIAVDDKLIFSALNSQAPTAYPIVAQSWCLIYAKQADAKKGAATKSYFKFMLTEAQGLLGEIDFAPLPKAIADKALVQLEKVSVP